MEVDGKALQFLSKIAQETSMRYAMQLIVVSSIIGKRAKRGTVGLDDVKHAHDLFLDVGRSCEVLRAHGAEYMFHEEGGEPAPAPGGRAAPKARTVSAAATEERGARVRIDEDE